MTVTELPSIIPQFDQTIQKLKIGNVSAVMRALYYSVVMKRELSLSKALNFQSSFCPHSHLWS